MFKVLSALTARRQFGQILRRVNTNNERFVIDRRGEPQAIIMSLSDYVDTIAPEPSWLKKIRDASKRRGTDRLAMLEIDAIVADARRQRRAKRSR